MITYWENKHETADGLVSVKNRRLDTPIAECFCHCYHCGNSKEKENDHCSFDENGMVNGCYHGFYCNTKLYFID